MKEMTVKPFLDARTVALLIGLTIGLGIALGTAIEWAIQAMVEDQHVGHLKLAHRHL
jgi:hypothetical protein